MRVKKQSYLGVGIAGVAVVLAGCVLPIAGGTSAPKRPNVVVVYIDDMDFDELAPYDYHTFPCYTGSRAAGVYNPPDNDAYFMQTHWHARGERTWFDNPRQYTPNLERLEKEGMRFDRFYVTSTVCTPSRYSLLTGRYASRCPSLSAPPGHPVKNILWNTPIAPQETSLIKDLNQQGYTTALFGKWHNHFYDPGAKKPYTWENIYPDIAPNANARDPAVLEKIHAGYQRAVNHLRGNVGFDVVGRLYPGNIHQSGLPAGLRNNNLEWMTQGVLDFINEPHATPFFLYFAINLPHRQNSVEENHSDPLSTPNGFLDEAPHPFASRAELMAKMKERGVDPRQFCSTWIDASIGSILDALERQGIADNTLVLVLSDHQSRGKFTCFEGARVPAFAIWPGRIPAGSVSTRLCANVDIAPTLLALAGGVAKPGEMDGRDLLPILEGRPVPDWRSHVRIETGYTRALVSNSWKYILNDPPPSVLKKMEQDKFDALKSNRPRTIGWDGGPSETPWGVRYGVDAEFPAYFDREQLYNLATDVFEQTNRVKEVQWAELLAEMRTLLRKQENREPCFPE